MEVMDRKNVIKGLEVILEETADMFYRSTIQDAIALLKAQESQATTHEAEWHVFKGRRGATCSYCKHTFDDVYDPENYDYYCRHCGARMVKIRTVKWE